MSKSRVQSEDNLETALETAFKEICKELDVIPLRVHNDKNYALAVSRDGIKASYRLETYREGRDFETMSFRKKSKIMVSAEIKKNIQPSYVIQMQMPEVGFESELRKIKVDKTRKDPDGHLSNIFYDRFKDRTPEKSERMENSWLVEKTMSTSLDGVKRLVLNQYNR